MIVLYFVRSIKYRFCIDYRSLNAVKKPDAYPIPNIVDTLNSLGHSEIFTVLDMASGEDSIPLQHSHHRPSDDKAGSAYFFARPITTQHPHP